MIYKGLIFALLALNQIAHAEVALQKVSDLVSDFIDGDVEMAIARRDLSDAVLMRRQNDGCSASSNGPPSGLPSVFPKATASRSCSKPVGVTGVFDGGLRRYDRGAGYRGADDCISIEPGSADTIFLLEDGATLQNVIIGQEVKDAVYCLGSCTLKNVYFERTCEDSLSLKNPTSCSSCRMTWTGGAVSGFKDKAVQHNGGGTTILSNIDVYYSGSGKFYRSCGGCSYPTRHVEMNNIRVYGSKGEALAGINNEKGDTAKLSNIYIPSSFGTSWAVCKKFPSGATGPDSTSCLYSSSSITWYTGSLNPSNPSPAVSPATSPKTSPATSPKTSPVTSPSGSCAAKYGQCGGSSYTGPKCCVSGSTCTYSNEWYSQCL